MRSRRLGPYVVAGIVGVASSVYAFKPFYNDARSTSIKHNHAKVEKPVAKPDDTAIYQSQANEKKE
ncbi:hypothetical protein GYMLUDRAFT_32506 [Collybiopsis luxurians FD-317 M1]|nr:hypothetical protein GYMLUDRAFT_32506 [Collybiopsis luxurians FD-317 M1]